MNARRLLLFVVVASAMVALLAAAVLRRSARREWPSDAPAVPHAFYLWQYEWTPAVVEAVTAAMRLNPDRLYVIAGELGGNAEPRPDWVALHDALQAAPATSSGARQSAVVAVIPVVRAHGDAARRIETAPEAFLDELQRSFHAIRKAAATADVMIHEVQLDLDCPDRLLAAYAGFLGALKSRLGDLQLTITAIPSHLANAAFPAVARACDGYTLQVHGVEFPRRFNDPASILDPSLARRAVASAERIGISYRLALPTYAYRFVFDVEGKCLGILQPSSPPPDPVRSRIRAVAADPAAVLDVLRLAGRSRWCTGVTWFRLPVKGDDACWDLPTIAALHAGRAVSCALVADWSSAVDGTLELRLTNHAVLDVRTVRLTIPWSSRQGDYGLISAESDDNALPGVLPTQIVVRVPPPGEFITVAWFRTAARPPPVVVTAMNQDT